MAFPVSIPGTLNIAGSFAGAVGHGTIIHVSDRNDIIQLATKVGLGSSTPTTGQILKASGAGTTAWATPGSANIILAYVAAADLLNGGTINPTTWSDVLGNQNFVVGNANSVVSIAVRGNMQVAPLASQHLFSVRLNVDSGTVYKLGGNISSVGANPLAGVNVVPISGLSAGTHTVKLQIYGSGSFTAYLRASTLPEYEHFAISVVEHTPV